MKLDVHDTRIEGVKVLTPVSFKDQRGEFFEAYNKRELEALGNFEKIRTHPDVSKRIRTYPGGSK